MSYYTRERLTAYTVREYREHGYDWTEIRVFTVDEMDVKRALASCTSDSYGSEDSANRARVQWERIASLGHDRIYEVSYGGGPTFTIAYMRARHGDYCEPRITMGESYRQIEQGFALLRKVGRSIERKRAREDDRHDRREVTHRTFAEPERVLAALQSARTSLALGHGEGLHHYQWVQIPDAGANKIAA